MHDGLGAIEQHRRASVMRQADDVLDRRVRAERIGSLRDGHQARARAQQSLEFLEQEITVGVYRRDLDLNADTLTQ